MPSLSVDALRVFLYGSQFILAQLSWLHTSPLGDSPLQALSLVASCPPALLCTHPAARVVPAARLPAIVRFLHVVCLSSWLACLLGFGGRVSTVALGVSALALHGFAAPVLGTNHRWLLPVLVLLAASAAPPLNGALSLDALLLGGGEEGGSGPAYAPSSAAADAVASASWLREAIFAAAAYTLFAGGVSKLRLGGLAWLDGETIRFSLRDARVGCSAPLKSALIGSPALCAALSLATLALELGCLAGFIAPQLLRTPILLAAAGFHVGIWCALRPNYFPSVLCYAAALLCDALLATTATAAHPHASGWPAAAAVAALAGLGVERWPLTCVPMYAFYRGPAGAWRRESIGSVDQARGLGREFVQSGLPWPIGWSDRWLAVSFVPAAQEGALAAEKGARAEGEEEEIEALAAGGARSALTIPTTFGAVKVRSAASRKRGVLSTKAFAVHSSSAASFAPVVGGRAAADVVLRKRTQRRRSSTDGNDSELQRGKGGQLPPVNGFAAGQSSAPPEQPPSTPLQPSGFTAKHWTRLLNRAAALHFAAPSFGAESRASNGEAAHRQKTAAASSSSRDGSKVYSGDDGTKDTPLDILLRFRACIVAAAPAQARGDIAFCAHFGDSQRILASFPVGGAPE